MAFGFRRRDPEEARRAQESLRSIEAGGLPFRARERLAALAANGGGAYTTDLSTAEFLLVREAGFTPITQVMGSCFYSVGWQLMPGQTMLGRYTPEGVATPGSPSAAGFEYDGSGRRIYANATFGQMFELDGESQAWKTARDRTFHRLSEEARLAGADAVVGVHLRRGDYKWSRGTIEFVAIGTAVKSDRYELAEAPVLSNLSGQDFAKLYANGFWPVGIVAGTAVVYAMTGALQTAARSRFARNQELADYTQGVQHARKVAVSRLARDARALGALGVVGLTLEVMRREHEHEGSRSRKADDLIVTAHVVGTAIVALDRPSRPLPIEIALQLDDGEHQASVRSP